MSDVLLNMHEYRQLIGMRYLNASETIYEGLQSQCTANKFHFLITLRSFIEYSRRGIWFLVWAPEDALKKAEKLTFDKPGSPKLTDMDTMINEALGNGKVSPLTTVLPGINEPFINCLHALTHGNPISVRFTNFGLDKLFDTGGLLKRAELELDIFRILLYRLLLGEKLDDIWVALAPIHNTPIEVRANALAAAFLLKQSGKVGPLVEHPFS